MQVNDVGRATQSRASRNIAGLIGAEEMLIQREVLINFTPFNSSRRVCRSRLVTSTVTACPRAAPASASTPHVILNAAQDRIVIFVDVENIHRA